eukprot:scaffold29782_cov21-Phaeocystis_antarctica.AAC.1
MGTPGGRFVAAPSSAAPALAGGEADAEEALDDDVWALLQEADGAAGGEGGEGCDAAEGGEVVGDGERLADDF